jgi:ElaA protein
MNFIYKSFNELTKIELYKILKLRCDVFVVEQNCPYHDIDDLDLVSKHLFVMDDGECIACLRLIPSNVEFEEASIGRVIVAKNRRGTDLGLKLVKKGIELLFNDMKEKEILIEAQSYAIKFYEKCGFTNLGKEHDLDNIKHVWMKITK